MPCCSLQTDEELAVTLAHCSKVQGKSDEAHAKASAERKLIEQDLNSARSDLEHIM